VPGEPGALVFAGVILLVCFSVVAVLHRNRIFIKL
jgi:predicted acyltransferase